jgi:hypothetical protein
MQPSYRSGRRSVLSPRDECTLVQKVQIKSRTRAKNLVKMLEETGAKVSISTVKTNPALSGGMDQNSPYCGKLVEGYPKRLTQVKQFKRQCYQILIECM